MPEGNKKQVIGGCHRPVCVKCACELKPEQNGFGVLDLDSKGDPLDLWDADKWKCPMCGVEIVGGFGNCPVVSHFDSDFKPSVESYMKTGLVKNRF